MPSTSKSNRRKPKKFKFIPKPKQQWQVKQPTRDWLELPSDVMANILCRVGVIDILESAQKVCVAWRKICKDPAIWRVIHMDNLSVPNARSRLLGNDEARAVCKHVVDRSQGLLIDITILGFCDDELLHYVAERSSQLKRLEIGHGGMYGISSETLKKLPLLEELSLYSTEITEKTIEDAGRYCPMLKTLKWNQEACRLWEEDVADGLAPDPSLIAIAIGENLHELEHIELIGNNMSNTGLQAILDGCRHLKSLDLRQCFYIDLKGDLGKRCSEQIKCLKLPNDSLEGCPYIFEYDFGDEYDGYYEYDGYDGYDGYDDYSTNFEDLNEMLAFMTLFQ